MMDRGSFEAVYETLYLLHQLDGLSFDELD